MTDISRRKFISHVTASTAAFSLGVVQATRAGATALGQPGPQQKATGLHPLAFEPVPLNTVQPTGWLERQLKIQAHGLSGHLDEFWPDVQNSKWFGGTADGWERAPYWLDGALPLAYLVGDDAFKQRVQQHIETILSQQRSDGWYGPYVPPQIRDGRAQTYDLWAIMLANKVLVQYFALSGDQRAMDAVYRCLQAMNAHIDQYPLFNWGKYRWFENLIAICSVYSQKPERWLLDLAQASATRF